MSAPRDIQIGYLHVEHPDPSSAEECPGCRFDSLLTFQAWLLTLDGVSEMGEVKVCPRCYDEGRD